MLPKSLLSAAKGLVNPRAINTSIGYSRNRYSTNDTFGKKSDSQAKTHLLVENGNHQESASAINIQSSLADPRQSLLFFNQSDVSKADSGNGNEALKTSPGSKPDPTPEQDLETKKRARGIVIPGTPVGITKQQLVANQKSYQVHHGQKQSAKATNWVQTKVKDTLDAEKNYKKREELIRKIGQSYWQNVEDLKIFGTKLYHATDKLIPEKEARYIPMLEIKSLETNTEKELNNITGGKVSLVTFEFTNMGQEQVKSFTSKLDIGKNGSSNNNNNKNKKFQLVRINIEENWMKAAIVKACFGYIRKQLERENMIDSYYYHLGGSVEPLRIDLNIISKFLGYVYLVDKNSKVRWYANGDATEKEVETMNRLVKELLSQ